ncbi:MAG: iron chaperone [Gemmobacter sp.]
MPDAVDAYLVRLPDDQHVALTALRETLRSLLPGHVECLSYAMPGFRAPGPKGRMVAGYAAFARHLGLYPHSGSVIPALQTDCAGWKTSKSGILFTLDHPLPAALVERIVRARQAEIAASGR